MLSVEELAQLPPRQYLEHFHVEFYLKDAINLFLSRRRGDGRSAPEFMGQYLESVLRGEHVLHRGFRYINSTPLNRRAFVSLLRQGLSGVADSESTALTAHDFHDLASELCSDFPLAVVLEAARHAKRADGQQHHLLGETAPFTSSLAASGAGRAAGHGERPEACGGLGTGQGGLGDGKRSPLLVLRSLQRLVEFCLVYSELLGALQHIFQEAFALWPARLGSPPGEAAAGPGSGSQGEERQPTPGLEPANAVAAREAPEPVLWRRPLLVTELRFYGGALAGAALPSERALSRLLRPPPGAGGTSLANMLGEAPPLSFEQALTEMAEHFELGLEPCSEVLAIRAEGLSEGSRGGGPEAPAAAASAGRASTPGPSGERRRRERSQKIRGRS